MKVISAKQDEVIATELDILVAQCFANDMRTHQVAQKAGKRERTMENIIAEIKRKYGVKTNAALVYLFCKNGLIE